MKESKARQRWKLLAQHLTKKTTEEEESQHWTILDFPNLDVIRIQSQNGAVTQKGQTWLRMMAPGFPEMNFKLPTLRPQFDADALAGPDQTGNIRVWPAEEALTAKVLANPSLVAGKDVIELGAGAWGLAGLAALSSSSAKLTLTDGNKESVCTLKRVLAAATATNSQARQLVWQEGVPEDLKESFDVALCADCLYFNGQARFGLVAVLADVLRRDGVAFVAAPKRGNSREHFIELATMKFSSVAVVEDLATAFSPTVAAAFEDLVKDERYDVDKHLPVLIVLADKK